MGVKNSALVDLLATTLPNLPDQYFEVTWDDPKFHFCRIYQTERMEIDGGTSIDRRVMFDSNGNARYRRLFDKDTPHIPDVMKKITVPWTQIGTHYSWDKRELKRNMGSPKGFIRLLETRRISGLWDLAKLIEERAWKTPTSATDDLYPYGVPYYINTLNADAITLGFSGQTIRYQDGSVGTVCAGLDAADEPSWRNMAGVYTKIDNVLLKTFRTAFLLTDFTAPLFVNDPSEKRSGAKRIYADADTVVNLQDLADKRQDNHSGKDVLGNIRVLEDGSVTINRLPVVYIKQLNDVTDLVTGTAYQPIYCIDFTKFIPYVQADDWMDEGEPMDGGTAQHTTFTVFLDGSHNNLCTNRKEAGFVLHKPIVT